MYGIQGSRQTPTTKGRSKLAYQHTHLHNNATGFLVTTSLISTTDEADTKTCRFNHSFKISTSSSKYSTFSRIFQWKNVARLAFKVTASL